MGDLTFLFTRPAGDGKPSFSFAKREDGRVSLSPGLPVEDSFFFNQDSIFLNNTRDDLGGIIDTPAFYPFQSF
jgi:hypothetical protein